MAAQGHNGDLAWTNLTKIAGDPTLPERLLRIRIATSSRGKTETSKTHEALFESMATCFPADQGTNTGVAPDGSVIWEADMQVRG